MRLFRREPQWVKEYDKGWEAGSSGRFDEAIRHFVKAIELAPNEPKPLYQLGYTHYLTSNYSEALVSLRAADQLQRGYFLAQTYIYLCEAMSRGAISEQAWEAIQSLIWLTDEGGAQSAEALTLSDRVIAAHPECPLGHFYRGKALVRSDRSRSETSLRKCLDLEPDETTVIDALIHLGSHREAAGDSEGARWIWQDVLDRYGDNALTEVVTRFLEQRFGTHARRRQDTPDAVLTALLSAHRIDRGSRVSSLCAEYYDIILSNFAAWTKVPPDYSNDRLELDHYVDTLVTVSEVFAAKGQPQLKVLLMGDETKNPYLQWSQTFTEAEALVNEGRCSEVIAPLEESLGAMQGARGSGVDDLMPKMHGLLGVAYHHLGLLDKAVAHTKTAMTLCELIGDTHGVEIYSANLQHMAAED